MLINKGSNLRKDYGCRMYKKKHKGESYIDFKERRKKSNQRRRAREKDKAGS